MKLGLGSYAFRWSIGLHDRIPAAPLTAFDLIAIAAQKGLQVVQFADNMPLDRYCEDDQHRLRRDADRLGLDLELGTQCFDAAQVEAYIAIGARIGAKILRVALDEADAHMPVADLSRQFRPLLTKARAAGQRIAIENHFNYPSPRMVELLQQVDDPALGVCLDVANSICAGEWTEETVTLLAPYTINLHFKDYAIIPDPYGVGFRIQGTPLGAGRAPLSWVLAQLSHCPPDMSVILEHWLPMGEDAAATRALEHQWLNQTITAARDLLAANATRGALTGA